MTARFVLRHLVAAAAAAVVAGPATASAAVPYATQHQMFTAIQSRHDLTEQCREYAQLEKASDGFAALDPTIATVTYKAVEGLPGGFDGLSVKLRRFADSREYGKACAATYVMILALEHIGKHDLVANTMLPAVHGLIREGGISSTSADAAANTTHARSRPPVQEPAGVSHTGGSAAASSGGSRGEPPVGQYGCYSNPYWSNRTYSSERTGSLMLGQWTGNLDILPGHYVTTNASVEHKEKFHMEGAFIVPEGTGYAKLGAVMHYDGEAIDLGYKGMTAGMRCTRNKST